MTVLNSRHLAVCILLIASFVQAASAAEILIADAKSQPESLTVAPGGVLIVGSASSPFVYPSCAENPAVQGGDVERGERSSPKLNSVSAAARCTGG